MGQYTIKDIQDQTELLKADVQRIYRSIYTKLGLFPKSLDQVPYYIITKLSPSSTKEPLTIQPGRAKQEFTTPENIKYDPIVVNEVTSEIDANIQPENIKEGVSILGVVGTLSGGSGGDTPDYRYMNGTVDKAGLKAIGWTDEDILTYEQNAPHYTWQNDQFKVSDENKALYLLDDPNPSSYSNNSNIEYVPKKNMESYFARSSGFSDMQYIKGIPFYDTSKVTNMQYLFERCSKLTTIPPLNTSSATKMDVMFYGCSNLISIPLLDTSNVTGMSSMFYGCSNLTTIPQLNTSNVTGMSSMFSGCSSLTTIPQLNTSKVTNMNSMFSSCMSIRSIPALDTSKVTDISSIFSGCSKLNTVNGIDFSGLTSNLTRLFGYSSSMPNITKFIVNGKINVSISDNNSIKALKNIDYDSVKSILAAADRTDNTNAKELAFNRTIADQNGELAALVASCTTKGWTITGLTLQ